MSIFTKKSPAAQLGGNEDTSFLKVLALCFMLVDHLGVVIFPQIFELRLIGRIAFPLYAWCLVVGSVKTSNIFRYGVRLLLVGAVSQPLYMMALSHGWKDFNILFTLWVGLAAIFFIQKRWLLSQFWGPALCFLLLGYIKVDYGWQGLAFILVLYGARTTRSGLIAAFMAFVLFWGGTGSSVSRIFGWQLPFSSWPGIAPVASALLRTQSMAWMALPLLVIPTHTKLKMPHWLGYGLYPMHLVLLIVLRLVGGASFATLTAGF